MNIVHCSFENFLVEDLSTYTYTPIVKTPDKFKPIEYSYSSACISSTQVLILRALPSGYIAADPFGSKVTSARIFGEIIYYI